MQGIQIGLTLLGFLIAFVGGVGYQYAGVQLLLHLPESEKKRFGVYTSMWNLPRTTSIAVHRMLLRRGPIYNGSLEQWRKMAGVSMAMSAMGFLIAAAILAVWIPATWG